MTDAEWAELEQEYRDERLVRLYIERTITLAHDAADVSERKARAAKDARINAAAMILRADKEAEGARERARIVQAFAEAQAREYGPLVGVPCPMPRPEASTVRA